MVLIFFEKAFQMALIGDRIIQFWELGTEFFDIFILFRVLGVDSAVLFRWGQVTTEHTLALRGDKKYAGFWE